MAITVADNFSYQGGKPLDARVKFSSINDMVSMADASLYDGCLAYVTATKKYYSYDSSNELDLELGKWREYSAGEEYSDFTGATSQAAGAHGLVPAPTTGDISKFLKGDGTWAAVPIPSFDYSNTSPEAMNFSTSEKVIGTWVDGKPLYQVTKIYPSVPVSLTPNTINHNIQNVDHIFCVDASCKYNGLNEVLKLPYISSVESYNISFSNITDTSFMIRPGTDFTSIEDLEITFRYTKTNDSAVASGEKIVGQWIDGSALYEKSIHLDWNSAPSDSVVNIYIDPVSQGSAKIDGKYIYGSYQIGDNLSRIMINEIFTPSDPYWTSVQFNKTSGSDNNIIQIAHKFHPNWYPVHFDLLVRYTKTS